MPSPRYASAFSSFTTICSGVCFENFLMVIRSARPQAAGTTQNNPLKTNGPKNPDPSTQAEIYPRLQETINTELARLADGKKSLFGYLSNLEPEERPTFGIPADDLPKYEPQSTKSDKTSEQDGTEENTLFHKDWIQDL